MRSTSLKTILKTAVLAATALLLTAGESSAQTVNLTAGSTSITLPDGSVVQMWGYRCTGTPVAPATCAASNPNAGTGWSPVLITVPPGNLTINLTNNLPAAVPETSLMIVGQLGGGLGTERTTTASPAHGAQSATWPIAGDTTGPQFTPPPQGDRVQSFGTPVAAGATKELKWTGLKPGTYLIESGTHPSIQGPMGLYGVLVVTTPASGSTQAQAYPGVSYDADAVMLLSEIDPVQNNAVNLAVNTAGFSETKVWSGQPDQCGNPKSSNFGTCYPPAVNYDPRYYLINGVGFDKTNKSLSAFATTPATGVTGTVLVRFVNAGLRMHVPSIVGALTGTPAVPGFSLIAEDGNVLPGTPRVQSEVFLPAGKVYDVKINAPAAGTDLPVFDRQLSLSTNNQRDGGMQGYINVNGGSIPGANPAAAATGETYYCNAGVTLSVSDPGKGVLANDVNANGATLGTVSLVGGPTSLAFNSDGTFTYTQATTNTTCGGTFTYLVNGTLTATATITRCDAGTGCSALGGAPVANADSYTSAVASRVQIGAPGVLANDTDPAGHPLCAAPTTATGCPTSGQTFAATGGTVTLNPDGSFTAVPTTPPTGVATAQVSFQYNAVNSQKLSSAAGAGPATVTVTFGGGSGLTVHVWDGPSKLPGNTPVEITDYRWIIEEDRTFHIDPNQVQTTTNNVPSLGTNFHTSYMPVVAAGCVGTYACEFTQTVFDPTTGSHVAAVCDVGDGVCRTDGTQQIAVDPRQVHLDPLKHYYISILPGDAGNDFTAGGGAPVDLGGGNSRQFSIALDCPSGPGGADFAPGTGTCGHGMGGAPIGPAQFAASSVDVLLQETPLQPSKISVFVFEDDNPLNGEADAGGGIDVLATNEPGLGGFQILLFDDAGGTGDATGQMTYDMFNMPLSNSLAGTIDPTTGKDACPISPSSTDGLVGMIVTCPKFESDGTTLSPLAGQAVIANMMPGRYGVVAHPGADRIGRGEEWLQTNTLDGQKAHDSFIKVGGPSYFQEFGPAGFHVSIGFANPAIINSRLPAECAANPTCTNVVTGKITDMRQSRTPDQRLYGSGTRDALGFTQCFVSLGDPDGLDIAFAKCDGDGNFTLSGIPNGDWRITVFDQWNDQIVDGLSTPVRLTGSGYNFTQLPVQQWHTNISTSIFFDTDKNGVRNGTEPGLTLFPSNIRFRDGSYSNFNNTDLNGNAGFNEIFPLFNWYILEADTTRYKQTGVHVVYDAGGPADGTPGGGSSNIAANYANTVESIPVPTPLRVPGAVYCSDADCSTEDRNSLPNGGGPGGSTGRIDPPWVTTEGWQGFIGQYEFVEFGKTPYATGENGGIHGEVIYASTRPFDDPALLIHTSWTPDVPGVTINLYQEGTAPDGTQSLKLVDTTKTTSWDDWAQGFHLGADNTTMIPNMSCPGQGDGTADPFFFTLQNTPQWLNPNTSLPNNSRFKCYDGLHNFNQVQPAPYDGMYKFPSVIATNPTTGKPTGTNCTGCVTNPVDGLPMLPAGKYVVEMIVPPGYELVKEEDKNILIGDNYIAPVTQQFGGLGSIFILPDQAEVNGQYNANNAQNPTNNLGSQPRHEGDTGSVETFWPCVGALRIVPDFISLFPYSAEVSPFAGASRHLCDRKEVTLEDQTSALAKFWVFSSTHVAAHFTGFILDDLSSEFDPFSPQFGEKFAVPNLPISIKDFAGNEILRTYSDQWGEYNGLNYSTWEVNPPNPTGYAPTMMVACMNDPGNGATPDPLYNPNYSQFCYEIPYMPGQTQYMDTPVVPTAAFAEGYNPPDCAYPDATPAIASVTGDPIPGGGSGPWVSASGAGHTLTIAALGDQQVPNPAYSGPQAKNSPYNQKFLTRHYGFGGTQGSGSVALVGPDGVAHNLTSVSWSDLTITGTVPTGVPSCQASGAPLQRSNATGGTYAAQCGELVITAGNGKKSIDAVTVTIGGKPPTYIAAENATNNAIQLALDNAIPGDLLIVGPGTYNEMLLMWKPVRLQGVGSGSVKINANAHPSGKLDPWRRQVNCLFGLALNGSLLNAGNVYDPTGAYSCRGGTASDPLRMQGAVDPLPLEGIVGWDTSVNGNLAELLQEPSLMGAYEGAAVTVLAKGQTLSIDASSVGTEGDFPAGSVPLTNSNSDCVNFPSNFLCNPSRIDGLTLTNSSQGGGGIFLHGWNHFTEVSNNRVFGNAGTLSGGITIGQGESPDAVLDVIGIQQRFNFEMQVRVHHNSITSNASYGDELFSATPSAAGGVTFCTGADDYHFNYNWVCGNLSTGDGGGVVHEGFIYNGDISHNWILFNQSNNISIPTNGGGIAVLGAAPDGTPAGAAAGTECGSVTDIDCAPGLSDGIGPGLVIDSNLIMGNTAESGSGGGIRLQTVNGTEVSRFPLLPILWYGVTVRNNIIANNVAGWDGGGVSMQDALKVDFINNTVASNDTTASSGVLFNTLGAPLASTPPTSSPVVTSTPQAAGLVTMQNTVNLTSSLPATIICPAGHPSLTINGLCKTVSYPLIENDLFWQNRAFNISVGGLGGGNLSQQNLVTLLPELNQTSTGQCVPDTGHYWDIGVRGDTGATNHGSGVTLSPSYSIFTPTSTGANPYPSANNRDLNPNVVSQYCNGARVPPENGGMGYIVPPGISDATVPNPLFNLTPAATVDEGNNWINMAYGPLALPNPTLTPGVAGYGNYGLTSGSADAINAIPITALVNFAMAPAVDYFGTQRKTNGFVDIGAVEFVAGPAIASVTGGPLAFGNWVVGTTSTSQTLTLHNTGGSNLTINNLVFSSARFSRPGGAAGGTCGGTLTPATGTCTINVVFAPTAVGLLNATLTINASVPVTGSPVNLSGTGTAVTVAFSAPNPLLTTTTPNTTTKQGTITVTNNSGAAITLSTAPTVVKTAGPASGVFSIVAPLTGTRCLSGSIVAVGGQCTIGVQYVTGGSTLPSTAHVNISDTLAGSGGTATQSGPNFNAN